MNSAEKHSDPEFDAIAAVYLALKDLDAEAQRRALDYVLKRLGLSGVVSEPERVGSTYSVRELAHEEQAAESGSASPYVPRPADEEGMEGISPVAQKWLRRNDLSPEKLSKYFSLGVEEIDLIAKSVNGSSKREKMHNIILLTGTAAYLGEGAARFGYDELKESLGHYNAYDGSNFATYMKDFAPEVSGSKESGYTLTSRGLAAAAELLKEMSGERKAD